MTPEVEQAIKELREAFPDCHIEVVPDNQGGAYVIVVGIRLGERFKPESVWIGFHITFQYPNGDVYPHHLDATVRKADGSAVAGGGVSGPGNWCNRQALQLSRRSHKWNPAADTAALKLLKVIEWIKTK